MALIDLERVCSRLDKDYLKKLNIYVDIPYHAINGMPEAPYNSCCDFVMFWAMNMDIRDS